MTNETPKITIRRKDSHTDAVQDFNFPVEKVRNHTGSEVINQFRNQAWSTYKSLPMPSLKDEAWRRTDIRSLRTQEIKLDSVNNQNLSPKTIKHINDYQYGGQVILTPQGSRVYLELGLSKKGVVFTDLLSAETDHPHIVEKIIGKIIKPEEGKFAALAAALSQNGCLIYVPKNVKIERPLHTLVEGLDELNASINHYLVYLEEGSEVTWIFETSSEIKKDQNVHIGNMEVYVGSSASLKLVDLQSWGENVWNFTHETVQVENDGKVDWIYGALGSRLTKTFSTVNLAGKGSEGKISGFYFTDKKQHLDFDTQQNHLAPHTTSDLMYKGALLGESHSVWQGMIYVKPGADKTDAYQANRNLILSPHARANSIPGLEILADDVRCTHGATVGKIDQEQVFYLTSRGIPRREAEQLIVEGYFGQIIDRIPFEEIKKRFEETIEQKMKKIESSEEITLS